MSRSRTIRMPDDLDAEIGRRAATTRRSYANTVITLLYAAMEKTTAAAPTSPPAGLPKIARRHWS